MSRLPSLPTRYFCHRQRCLPLRVDFQSHPGAPRRRRVPAARKIDTWAPNGPTKTGPTGTRQQKRMHIMNGWTRRRRNGCQKYIAAVHPLSFYDEVHTWSGRGATRVESARRRQKMRGRGCRSHGVRNRRNESRQRRDTEKNNGDRVKRRRGWRRNREDAKEEKGG